ncbi:inorganic phosphate transporter [Blattabacterium sp. (Cryptocercus kyebangensis)]|uniref:inorganic phosphate transporter n=1 Tax=Blattabacterium sp. (Cryptocercus kyebangensis) TaxID=298656 RepID=UPI000D7CA6F2|nr:inorganic phosphate transporter [Blattabacterium sp. (Cryptocercus kyebangensis)]AWU43773.1 inorganic phosphate transporter [Blattabacterium sp. (Cryptocercus kyebangensis)]
MKIFYPSIIVILFILSIFDLIVGLINDAVNFLNSAIGSKVASRKTIIIFASLGILLGAFLSSRMMEIARKGIFDPSYFYFSDLIFIFLAVMISDIILLDIFNTLGLPTSTTVSMVFCLLGGAFSISMIKISSPLSNEPLHHLSQYIKAEKTLTIGIGIFLSIIISFFSGAFIHYFIRILLSFEYKSRLKYAGVIWASISLSSMTYFLIVRGLHSTLQGSMYDNLSVQSLLIPHFIKWIHHNFFFFFILLFTTWIIVSKVFVFLGYNILKFVVLYGTFSLAMAFAGNDLVNFIGVPIASIQSYNIWKEAGSPPAEGFNMKSLSGNVQIPSFVLIFSGIIMILTLWFSKKTKTITSTEINLSRQNEGNEKFLSNSFARGIVRFFLFFGNKFFNLFPKRFLVKIEKNFKKKIQKEENISEENIAFDLVRASSNLTISSILISIATVKNLPLSTTFVTFMVSMGTSLSDRAWDRESAVYRISGVLKVIRGWFLTGVIAFTMAGIIAYFLYFIKVWALIFFIFLMVLVFYKSYKKYQKIQYQKVEEEKTIFGIIGWINLNKSSESSDILEPMLKSIELIYKNSIEGITKENLKPLKDSRKNFLKVKENFTYIQNSLIRVIKKTRNSDPIFGRLYIRIYNKIKEILESEDIITNCTLFHVINSHNPLKYNQKKNLLTLEHLMMEYFSILKKIIINRNCKYVSHTIKINILKKIEEQINQQVKGIIHKKYGTKNTLLMLDVLIQSKKITENIEDLILLYKNFLSHISSKRDTSILVLKNIKI